jgi:serine/threonine protein kinase
MNRTLKPDDRIARYRVVGPLGAGGMGEVYRARDQALERDVALKILPPDLVRNDERLRRFVLEAKSASSLNHPHIVTIYEIGEDAITPADGATGSDSGPLHFISMELVNGQTLSAKIHEEKTGLKVLLDWLAQAAEGLAKAHASGIVHRDLKPGNIMVSRDGYAKVLDFGLAKLTERRVSDDAQSQAPTSAPATGEGVVLGTVGYMSPEQVRGRTADARSDIFSFGCILYEAATRREPFAAASSVESMHRILHDVPTRIEELNPKAPAELRRLVRRCLAKNPDQRLQSMKDLALELREIVEEYDTLSASASSSTGALPSLPLDRRRSRAWWLVAGAVTAAIVVLALWARRGSDHAVALPGSVGFSVLSLGGDAWGTALSRDGRFLAYVTGPSDRRTIRVRQLGSESDVEILPPQASEPWGLRFSPDGSYLYYVRTDVERPSFSALFQIPTLGGTPRRRAFDVDSAPTFSPDGKRLCYRRHSGETEQDRLLIKDLDSDQERILTTIDPPRGLIRGPEWSPDGTRIATVVLGADRRREWVTTFRASDGRRDSLAGEAWDEVASMAWLPDGRGLLLAARELDPAAPTQIWTQAVSSGARTRVTNDRYDYAWVGASGDGSVIATQRNGTVANLWSVDLAAPHDMHQLTNNPSVDNRVYVFNIGLNGSVFFVARRDDRPQIVTIPAGSTTEKQLSNGPNTFVSVRSRPDGSFVFGRMADDGRQHLWTAEADGGNARQITRGPGENARGLTRDGRVLIFDRIDRPGELWAMPSTGGAAHRVLKDYASGPWLSPDSRWFAVTRDAPHRPDVRAVVVFPVLGGAAVDSFSIPRRAYGFQWVSDAKALGYLDAADSSVNVHVQPIDGGPSRTVTSFRAGRILDHRWAADLQHLLLTRRVGNMDNLWAASLDGSHAVQLTSFPTGQIFGMNTPADGKRVLFAYGATHGDVVMIRGLVPRR